ncbi:MAG: hypothetical protein RLZZ252_1929 [Bacteroidota bacterium]|jgi:hypothetical protein
MLGQLLNTDNLVLSNSDEVKEFIAKYHSIYSEYLKEEGFPSFNIFVPQYINELDSKSLDNFVKNHGKKGTIKRFLPVNNLTKFDELVGQSGEGLAIQPLFILPTEDFNYKVLRHKLWYLHIQNFLVIILKPNDVKEWKRNFNLYKQMSLKGVQFAVHVSEGNFITDLLEESFLKKLKQEKLFNFWLTTLNCLKKPSQRKLEKKVKTKIESDN